MVRARTVALLLCAAAITTLAYADDEPYEPRPDADAEPAEPPSRSRCPRARSLTTWTPTLGPRAVWNYSRVAHDVASMT